MVVAKLNQTTWQFPSTWTALDVRLHEWLRNRFVDTSIRGSICTRDCNANDSSRRLFHCYLFSLLLGSRTTPRVKPSGPTIRMNAVSD